MLLLLLLLLPLSTLSSQCLTLSSKHLSGGGDVETEDDLAAGLLMMEERGVKKWIGKRLVYTILNTPHCSDDLTEDDINRIIDRAAEQWNNVPLANVLLVNSATLPTPTPLPDFKISFQPCQHDDTTLRVDQPFTPCDAKYAHAIHGGDIHLNSMMTWSQSTQIVNKKGDPIRPNLYSLILHELGHTLGLQEHSTDPNQAMYGVFVGDRLHEDIFLGQEDMRRLQDLYPISGPTECKDDSPFCTAEQCDNPSSRGACPATCGDCMCNVSDPDVYLKCTQDICDGQRDAHLRKYCTKTCKSCEGGPDDVITPDEAPEDVTLSCTSPPQTPQLVADVQFPIQAGVSITVTCGDGYTLTGDSSITCVSGDTYSYTTQPTCEQVKKCKNSYGKCKKLLKKGKKCSNKFLAKNCMKSCELC